MDNKEALQIIEDKTKEIKERSGESDNAIGSFLNNFQVPTEETKVVCSKCGEKTPITETQDKDHKTYCNSCFNSITQEFQMQKNRKALDEAHIVGRNRDMINTEYKYTNLERTGQMTPCRTFKDTGDFLILYGNNGTGKTLLSLQFAKRFIVHGKSVVYKVASWLFSEIRSSYSPVAKETEYSILQSLITPDLLIIDELGKTAKSNNELNLIEMILSERYNLKKKTILVSNMQESEIGEYLGTAIMDRSKNDGKINFDWESER